MSEALKLAVAAYDEARCASHGPFEQPMSERNRQTIAPMIMAAVWAYQAATVNADAVTSALVILARRFNLPPDVQELLVAGNPEMGIPPGALAAAIVATPDPARKTLEKVKRWAESRCPCHNEEPDPCPLCGASVENLEACKSAENTLPRDLLLEIRSALSKASPATAAKPASAFARGQNRVAVDMLGVLDEASLSPAATSGSEAGGEPWSDAQIATVWSAAMTAACNIVIKRQNDLNETDAPVEILNEQGDIIVALKKWLEPDSVYLDELRSMLGDGADLAKPASSPAGGDVSANLLTAYHAIDEAWLASTGGQRLAKHDALVAIHEASRTLSPSTSAAESVAWIANCCHCGRIIDTSEEKEGGDKFGCELTDGRWTCSPECWDAVVEPDATPPAPAAVDGQRVKALEWSEIASPNDQSRYDHVVAATPFGPFLIEWKSWKACSSFVVYLDDIYLSAESTLDEAKAAAQADYEARIRACLATDKEGA